MSGNNWRVSPETGLVEIRSDEGRWVNPDCACECAYCSACLGCLKRLYRDDAADEDFRCPGSPDGGHHLIECPEKN